MTHFISHFDKPIPLDSLMMMITANSRARKGGGYGKIWEEEGNADYGRILQTSRQHFGPCVKGVEWVLGTRGLGIMAVFCTGIPVEVIQETGVIPRCRHCDRDMLLVASYDTQGNDRRILAPAHRGKKP